MFNIIAASYGNISDIEIMWTLLALGGAFFAIFNLIESHQDLAALKDRDITDGRFKIAKTGLRAEIARLTIQIINATIGIMAMTYPDPPSTIHESLRDTIFRFFFTWGFIFSATLLSLQSYWNYSLRHDLQRSIMSKPNLEQSVEGTPLEEKEDKPESQ